ncbi:uncharacterized protein LOC126763651 [Bactrocera neohumeralis]|uniref:uncharacterized protein LOC120776383 n=1 Tax=Bactrocera tryoni TaxID=59916 RepID=UPI001A994447|nr:uncharacterized protein LOC120776383 [Bactrocera tryoni]XP_050337320.1 uncharacterized protein LOC126763651 [Bactrocera neohumeralis]
MSYNNSGIDFDYLLTKDFLLFLDLCRDPNQVFTPNSDESCLAQLWLDKLCRYDCADLDERRLRNIYMSYLCCCLIEGVLKGPFSDQPRDGRLQMVNFNAVKKQPLSCPVVCPARTTYKGCEDPKSKRFSDNCEQQLGSCYSSDNVGNSVAAGSSVESSVHREIMRCSTPEVRFSTDIQCEPSANGIKRRSSGNVFSNYMVREIITPSAYNTLSSECSMPCDCCQEYDAFANMKDTFRRDVIVLLKAIEAELSGYVGSGCNKYLESELLRYKSFIMNFSHIARVLNKLKSQSALRSFLLLSLQDDLIKLINEPL